MVILVVIVLVVTVVPVLTNHAGADCFGCCQMR